MRKKSQITMFIIIGLLVVFVTVIYFYISEDEDLIALSGYYDTCDDGTPINTCSLQRPLLCTSGELTESCFECGCPEGKTCDGTECKDVSNQQPFNFTVFLVPINYEPNDPIFIERTEEVTKIFSDQTNLIIDNFVIVNKSLKTDLACDIDTTIISVFVDEWYKENTGLHLPAREGSDIFPIFKYRVIGIDNIQNEILDCGAGFTYFYSESIYMGGTEFAKNEEIVAHEFGHTIGLCEEYDTCLWDFQDQLYNCRNKKPDQYNSDCGKICCSEDTFACCNGKFADEGYNIMGSANIPPHREFNFETQDLLNNYICNHFGECETK